MQLEKPETSLSQRVAKGGMWVFALRGLEKGLGLIRLVILARLLAPHDFGLFGIALLAMSTLETFSQTGFQTALIQKKGDITQYLDTAWTVSVIRAVILFVILFFSASYVAHFFNTPEASLIIKIIGISMLIGGFSNIGTVFFQKELEFNKQFIYRLSTALAEFIVVISAALAFKNVWAFVYGSLAGSVTGLIVSYAIHSYRPHFRLDVSKAKELFGFGRWIFGSSILAFLITQGDDAIVGKFLGAMMLGFYQMAYRISNMPATEITNVISQVTFPAYSKIQDNLPRLRESYLRVLQLTAFLSFPTAGLIFILAPDFTKIFLGEKWMPMVPAMQVLVLWGLIRSIGATTGPIFLSIGKPGIPTKLQFSVLFLLSFLIYPLSIKWGILGASLTVFFSTLVPNLIAFFVMIRIVGCRMLNFGKMIAFPLINTAFLISFIILLKTYCINLGIGNLFLSVILSLILYCCITYLFDKFLNFRLFDNIKMNIHSLKRV
jgi:lipopolysaccharide exporter